MMLKVGVDELAQLKVGTLLNFPGVSKKIPEPVAEVLGKLDQTQKIADIPNSDLLQIIFAAVTSQLQQKEDGGNHQSHKPTAFATRCKVCNSINYYESVD